MSRFFCLWIQHFPAWAARRANSEVASAPFVVYAKDHIIAISPEAQLAGAQVGWTLHRLESLLPDVHAIPANPTQEAAVWQDVLDAVYSLTPQIESLRPGLLIADAKPDVLAEKVHEWRAYGGTATDRATAEIAAYSARRGEVRVIPPAKTKPFLDSAPVSVLASAGVSEKVIERLLWFGWKTVGSLADAKETELCSQFPAEGRSLHRFAQGKDSRRVPTYSPPISIVERFFFEEPARQPAEWEGALQKLVDDISVQLRDRETSKLEVVVETATATLKSHKLTREPLSDARTLYNCAQDMAMLALGQCPGAEVHALELHLSALRERNAVQGDLFATGGKKVTIGFGDVLRQLFARHPDCIVRAEIIDRHAALPEEAYRFVPIHPLPDKKKVVAKKKPVAMQRKVASRR